MIYTSAPFFENIYIKVMTFRKSIIAIWKCVRDEINIMVRKTNVVQGESLLSIQLMIQVLVIIV